MRRRFGSKNLSLKILKERTKEELAVLKEKEKEDGKSLDEIKHKTPPRPVMELSRHEYALHKKARDTMASGVGLSCERLHRKVITKDQFKIEQTDYAKKAIRETNLYIARRAWQDLMIMLLEVPGRNIKGIPILFQPLVDYWHEVWGLEHTLVDPVETTKEEKKDESKKSEEA